MVLDTLGNRVNVADLIRDLPPSSGGINYYQVRRLLRSQGVDAVALPNRTIRDLRRYTEQGSPVVVRITGSNNFSHFVVVDGVRRRQGIDVVAIRDPQSGQQYFSPVSTFRQHFTREVVFLRGTP